MGSVLVGYARISTADQQALGQVDRLKAVGCVKVFTDTKSGSLASRPGLDDALGYLRDGDTLVITKLDRLGRSVKNLKQIADELQARGIGLRALDQGIDTSTASGRLFFTMLAAIAEFERDMIIERTRDGLASARARGRNGGRPSALTAEQVTKARRMYDGGEFTVQQIADTFGVARPTIYRHFRAQASR